MARLTSFQALAEKIKYHLLTLAEGDSLASEEKLANMFKVSKPTLRRALAQLASEGIIETRNGCGSTLKRRPVEISRSLLFLCNSPGFFAETLEKFSKVAIQENCLPSILPFSGSEVELMRVAATALAMKPSGIILYAPTDADHSEALDMLKKSGIPILYLMRLPVNTKGFLLGFDTAKSIEKIVMRFYASGCRRFALYGTRRDSNPQAAIERRNGFLEGLRRCRLKPKSTWIYDEDGTAESQEIFWESFRNSKHSPDAVCCLNDLCAAHFLNNLKQRGISADHLSISGFDNSPIVPFLPHKLVTVVPPLAKLGEEAVHLMLKMIDNPNVAPVSKILDTPII